MAIFGFGKKDRVVDLSESLRKKQARLQELRNERSEEMGSSNIVSNDVNSNVSSGLGFLGAIAGGSSNASSSDESEYATLGNSDTVNPEEKRRRLTKRLMDMTEKLESLSNQIYHLQQRVELLEKKSGVGY